jgi:hypothetical protein
VEKIEDDPAEPEKKEEEKTVPHGAFHAEREKRKEAQKRAEELESQVQTLIKDNRAFMEKSKQTETEQSNLEALIEEGDYDSVLRVALKENGELKRRLEALEAGEAKRSELDAEEVAKRSREQYQQRVSTIATDLEKDGFPGFDMFVDKMNTELNQMIADDPDNASYDNDEGYKKIYKERIFPSVKKLFAEQVKEDALEKKRKLKEKANIGKGSGGSPSGETKKDDDENLTTQEQYQRYLKDRETYSHG